MIAQDGHRAGPAEHPGKVRSRCTSQERTGGSRAPARRRHSLLVLRRRRWAAGTLDHRDRRNDLRSVPGWRGNVLTETSDDVARRVNREREFADAESKAFRRVRGWIYRAIGEFDRSDEISTLYDPSGRIVLDYGCGLGALTTGLAERGAELAVGIDVSAVRLGKARLRAKERGLAGSAHFVVVDGHRTAFADDSFDLVVGRSVLHHLDLRPALVELRRILKPGGSAVFSEPLWHNPILRAGRAVTPWARTRDEHPITEGDWDLCASIFPGFRHTEREFVTIPFMPLNLLLPRRSQAGLARRLSAWDDRILERHPNLRRYSRTTFLVLQ